MADIPLIDPVDKARAWLAENPDHEAACHVRAALESADRHELLAQEAEKGGSRVVIATLGSKAGNIILTSTNEITERRVAQFIGRYLLLLRGIEINMRREQAESTLDWCDRALAEIESFRDEVTP